jgi:hypothetical protein
MRRSFPLRLVFLLTTLAFLSLVQEQTPVQSSASVAGNPCVLSEAIRTEKPVVGFNATTLSYLDKSGRVFFGGGMRDATGTSLFATSFLDGLLTLSKTRAWSFVDASGVRRDLPFLNEFEKMAISPAGTTAVFAKKNTIAIVDAKFAVKSISIPMQPNLMGMFDEGSLVVSSGVKLMRIDIKSGKTLTEQTFGSVIRGINGTPTSILAFSSTSLFLLKDESVVTLSAPNRFRIRSTGILSDNKSYLVSTFEGADYSLSEKGAFADYRRNYSPTIIIQSSRDWIALVSYNGSVQFLDEKRKEIPIYGTRTLSGFPVSSSTSGSNLIVSFRQDDDIAGEVHDLTKFTYSPKCEKEDSRRDHLLRSSATLELPSNFSRSDK